MIIKQAHIDFENMTVDNGDIVYDMEDLCYLAGLFERLSTAEYLFENQSENKPLTMKEAYDMADFIREKVDDYCGCEGEMITYWYAEAYAYAKGEEERD